jgi:hypothetical protein
MIIFAGIVLGAVWGAYLARRRQGNRLDMLQYGAAFALAFGMVGLFINIFLVRMG